MIISRSTWVITQSESVITYGKTVGENLVELVEALNSIDVTPEKIKQNAISMTDADGNIIEY